jgi:thioredoxin 1
MFMKKAHKITDVNFHKEVEEHKGPAVVEFFATWCGHCQNFEPVYQALAGEFGDKIKMCQLDIDQSPEMTEKYRISGTPTIIFFKNGKKEDEVVGEAAKETMQSKLRAMLGGAADI